MFEITLEKLQEWLKTGECETIEFKEALGDEVLEAIGAFANAKGGILLIGIKDSGAICGVQVGKKTLEDVANKIQEVTDPRLQPSISVAYPENKTIIVINVTPSTGMPVSVRGRYLRRVGKTVQRMSHEEIMQRMIASSGLSWDAGIEPTATLEDLNFEAVNHFVQLVKKERREPVPDKTSDKRFLERIELIRNDQPTRAALLLFGKNPDAFFPSAFLKMGRFRSPTHIVDDREAHGTLFEQIDQAMSWFRERLETEFIIKGEPEREVHWEYPLEAIREAVINVVCHRDYQSHAHSQIRLYDDHLEFWNAGGLPPSLTPEALFDEHDSIPRNRKIAQAFYYAAYIERWGSGTIRIAEELQKYNLPLPQFKSELGRFRLVLNKDFFSDAELRKMELSERQLRAIKYMKIHGHITNAQYQTVAGVSERTATRELQDLRLKNILVTEGKHGRAVIYRLKTPQ